MINSNNEPYVRKKISPTLLALSAALALLLLGASPLLYSNLLQPVQATTSMSFRTPTPASGSDNCVDPVSTITFDASGTVSSSGDVQITSGTFNVTSNGEPYSYSGKITSGTTSNNSNGGVSLFLLGTVEHVSFPTSKCTMIQGSPYRINTQCSRSNTAVSIYPSYEPPSGGLDYVGFFNGVVECPPAVEGDATIAQPSPSSSPVTGTTTTTQQDSDGDGIPDSSDKCIHNSNQRCFKEGNSTTTTHEQEQPPSTSSNDRTGNQTR
jgi:hypothetical protein